MVKFYKKIFNNNLWLTGSLTYYFVFIIMILIPVYYWFLPPFMILWGVSWIYEIRKRKEDFKLITFKYTILYILFFAFYFWQLLGMLYSANQYEGWRNLGIRLSLFLFPLVLISPGVMIYKRVNFLIQLFAISTLIYMMICFGYAFYRSIHFENGSLIFNPHLPVYTWLNYFYGFDLAITQHPSYLSMYVLLSLFISIELFFIKYISFKQRLFWLIVTIGLLISIYFLSSRAAILAIIVTTPFYLVYKYIIDSGNRRSVLYISLFFIILIPAFSLNPRLENYFKSESKEVSGSKFQNESRLVMWKAASNIIRHNLVFGVGTGDIQDELNKEYLKTSLKNSVIGKNFNAHNQFIEVLVENGLIGLILFLSIFVMMFYISFSERNILYIVFIIITITSFMFETMLNRLAGVSFFALFSFLLLHLNSGSGKSSEQISNA